MKTYKLTAEDFSNALSLNASWKPWGILALALAIGFYWAVDAARTEPNEDQRIVPIAIFAIGAAIIIATVFNTIRRNRRYLFLKHRSLQEEVSLDYDADEIRLSSASASFQTRWDSIPKYKHAKGVLLLYHSGDRNSIIPDNIFTPEELDFILAKLSDRNPTPQPTRS